MTRLAVLIREKYVSAVTILLSLQSGISKFLRFQMQGQGMLLHLKSTQVKIKQLVQTSGFANSRNRRC